MIWILNNFWGILYPGIFRYPLYLFLILPRLFLINLKKPIKVYSLILFLNAILFGFFYGVRTLIYIMAVLIIVNLFVRLITKTSVKRLLLISRINIYLSIIFILSVQITLDGKFYLISDYISLEPSNLAFSIMVFLLINYFYGGKRGKIELVIVIIIVILYYESLTFLIGITTFLICLLSDRFPRYVFKIYSIIALCLPIFFLTFPDIITAAKAFFLSQSHASGYVWFNGWESAIYAFERSYFGAGVPSTENHFRDPMSSELFDNLNVRGLGSLNAFSFGVFGVFYFIFFFWLIIKKQDSRNKIPLIILNVYLFMLMGRWAGIFNGTFLLVIALYLHSSIKLRCERRY